MRPEERIKKVIDFIGQHLGETLSLEQLCDIACFSKHHFHRLFSAYTGLSLQRYIKWLRLKRAAHQLTISRDETILTIALNAGFETHESFTRAFKEICGKSPNEFRHEPTWQAWESPPHEMHHPERNNMQVTIKQLPARRLAAITHHGDPNKIGESIHKLETWAKAQPVNLKPGPDGDAFGFGYVDPKKVPAEEFYFDLAITVPDNLPLTEEVFEKRLPAGRYAVAVHKGSRQKISDTIYGLYDSWHPQSKEELADFPFIFCYYNDDRDVPETEILTEVWLLLK